MRAIRVCVAGASVAALWAAASGCVARAEYDKVEFARRAAAQRATEMEREVADERAQRAAVEADRNATRRELDTARLLAENLRAENARLDEQLKREQGLTNTALAKGWSDPQVIQITKLPPELDNALKEFAAHNPSVEYLPHRGSVRWKSDLTFALGSDSVRDAVQSPLREFAEIVNSPAAQDFEVVIVGHTDNVPIRASNKEHKTNWHLSTHRAIAVMFALNRFGVAHERIGCMGYGEHRPREANPATGGNEKNRRVEIFLVSKKTSFAGDNDSDMPMPTRSTPARATPTPNTETHHPDGARPATDTPTNP